VSQPRYRVSPSARAIEQARAALDRAEVEGDLPAAVEALEWAFEQMQSDPNEFGESRTYWPNARLQQRIGFAGPLVFDFGVHEDTRTVFVIRVGWTRKN
jgi:hypothetical protein